MSSVLTNAAFAGAGGMACCRNETSDSEEKRLLLELVADFERLAERAAKREQDQR
jgi:hypothetical protein